VRWLAGWVPDDGTRRIILADTPARLFRFDRLLPAAADKQKSEEASP
jgi:hypothetical protein